MIYFCFFFLQMTVSPPPPPLLFFLMTPHTHTRTSYDRIIIYDNNNRFCRDEYKYNTRTLQCVLEKQERKSVWVYALDLYVLATVICADCSDFEIITYTFGPSREKTYLRSFRPDYCNYQPAQPQRLARILKFRLSANNEDVDQTTQIDLLFYTTPKDSFSPIIKEALFLLLFVYSCFFFKAY